MKRKRITVNDRMQTGYSYDLQEPTGKNFDEGFAPRASQSLKVWRKKGGSRVNG